MGGCMIDLRFPTALQMVLSVAMAHERDVSCTSGELAAALGANPALVRKLMVLLGRDGIIVSSPGRNGGIRLGRSPESITLLDVHRASVECKRLFASRPNVPDVCVVSRNIGRFFDDLTDEAGAQVAALLAGRSIADSLRAIHAIDGLNASQHRESWPALPRGTRSKRTSC